MRLRWRITGPWFTASQTVPRPSKKQRVAQFAKDRGWETIGGAEWEAISAEFPGIAPLTLEEAGLIVEQPWRGVKQHTFDELAETLIELAEIYAARPELSRFVRAQVIQAKDRAKWASRSRRVDAEKRKNKAEMAEWMLVWVDDPSMFPAWVERRRAVLLHLAT
jgi:hypothetical protein